MAIELMCFYKYSKMHIEYDNKISKSHYCLSALGKHDFWCLTQCTR